MDRGYRGYIYQCVYIRGYILVSKRRGFFTARYTRHSSPQYQHVMQYHHHVGSIIIMYCHITILLYYNTIKNSKLALFEEQNFSYLFKKYVR